MMQTNHGKKKLPSPIQNIKVVVRVRPLNNEEKEKRVKTVVNCVSCREIQTKDKKYQFDKVFPADSSQMDVYSFVVAPMISDVLAGYNCTVFAYGQTGTGKTHTMTGGDPDMSSNVHWKSDELAGCIPRTAAHIFEEISAMDVVEYNVRVSFLELYNEEVRDLLTEDERPPPLNIFNDSKGSVYVQGLNEITVFNSNDIYMLLQKGTLKRQTAATLMNNHSSRSHTVFTITVATREANLTGEEVLKTGKINLVDLAGSENIAKSGARDKRAQELANINRSLLTLGRVIQILAEKNNKHVPYRDSKLTRILQDSLGGHTKTCIIATVSPSHTSYEETQSTLEYACRARDIRNTPMINEKVTKAQMIKDMTHEIEKLKRDLDAARVGDGFYIDRKNWEDVNEQLQINTNALTLKSEMIDELKKKMTDIEVIKEIKVKEFEQVMDACQQKEKIINRAKALLRQQKCTLKQEQFISNCYAKAATENTIKAQQLLETTKLLSQNQDILQKKLENQYLNNYTNEKIVKEKSASLSEKIGEVIDGIENVKNSTSTHITNYNLNLNSIRNSYSEYQNKMSKTIQDRKPTLESLLSNQSDLLTNYAATNTSALDQSKQKVNEMLGLASNGLCSCIEASDEFEIRDNTLLEQNEAMASLLTNIQSQLIQQRKEEEELMEQFYLFGDITKNRINKIDVLISSIDSSKCTKSNSDKKKEDTKKARIKTKLNDVQETCKNVISILEVEKNNLEVHEHTCTEKENKILLCSTELKENIFEDINHGLKEVQLYGGTLNSELDSLQENIMSIKNSIETDLNEVSTLLKNANDDTNIVEKIIPVQRAGDTPKQTSIIYPKRVGEGALPRDVLLKKFKEEFSEDIENESFHLNVSSDSVQPLDDFENSSMGEQNC